LSFRTLVKHLAHRAFVAPSRLSKWRRHSEPFEAEAGLGRRFLLHPGQYLDQCIYVDGAYERRFLDFLRRNLPPGGVMLDVGANIGNHAVYLSDLFDEVHCFEPSPKIAARLSGNVRLNGLSNVHVHRVGLGAAEALLPFEEVAENLGLSRFDPNGEGPRLAITIGDKWVSDRGLERVDFIKIDVEGFELEVLKGLRQTIERFSPVIAFEYFGREPWDAFLDLLPGYQIQEPQFTAEGGWIAKLRHLLKYGDNAPSLPVTTPERRFYPYLLATPAPTDHRWVTRGQFSGYDRRTVECEFEKPVSVWQAVSALSGHSLQHREVENERLA
jgi:FkbM family methyltransferase